MKRLLAEKLYSLMLRCWELSECHPMLKPLEYVGNLLEDIGLDHGLIVPRMIDGLPVYTDGTPNREWPEGHQ